MIRLQTYAGLSFLATLAVIYHAFHSRSQFYPAMVYLSTSKISLMLLLNMGFVLMCIAWQITKKIFLGSLREAEVERLNEQAFREVMEILFAVTIFRQDFSVSFLAMVTALLLVKALHWLAQKRVEYIETTPSVPTLSHVRIISFLGFLFLLDSLFFYNSAKYLIQTRHASVSLFFAFEYMILATTTVSTFMKYIFYVSDMLMDGQWEKKAVYTFYLELIRDLLHLTMYLCFFLAIFINYGVPLHLIRELYETFRNFKVRISDYIRYRKITSNMNNRFPDATPEELTSSDATCIICREEMTTAKKLNCGHLFHVHCLRSWLERQHTCPTCRAIVAPPDSETNISGSRPNIHQQGTSPDDTSSQTPAGNSQVRNAHSQHEARIRAAAAAASIYEKSFVYPSANTLAWSAGYSLSPQATGAQGSAVNTLYIANTHLLAEQLPNHPSGSHPGSVPSLAPSTDPNYEESFADAASLSTSQLKEQNLILRNQIQVLRNKLELLRKQRPGKTVGPSSSNDAGKAVESSSSKVLDNDQLEETQKSEGKN